MLNTMTARATTIPTPLDWVRWGFVVVPMLTVLSAPTHWIWLLFAATLVAATPLLWTPPSPTWLLPVAMALVVAGTGTLWVLMPNGWVSTGMYSTTFYAVRFLPRRQHVGVIALNAVCVLIWIIRYEVRWVDAVLLFGILVVIVLLGLNRQSRVARLEQAELALARAQAVTEEHARAAALAERTRIARELHDVLAHSLAGLALNLQGARLMLVRDNAGPDAIAQIERAQKLAADGMSEARRAVAALRDDPVPVARAVADLVTSYRLDTGARAELTVHGEPRDLDTAAGTTVLRAVQEALANTRKHAPSAPVRVTLRYTPDQVEVDVVDQQGRRPSEPVTAGYGLRGMRERVELLAGALDSGPVEDGWRVHLTVPG
jgi:signal transduction histidine kinase